MRGERDMTTLKMLSTLTLIAMATTAVSAQEAAPAKPPAEKKICRADAETGSILAHRRCHTRAEWAEINRESSQRNAKEVDRFSNAVRRPDGTGFSE